MDLHVFLYLSGVFAAAYGSKALTSRLKIPEVTGYVLLGVLLGSVHFLTPDILEGLGSLTSIALGIIAFLIGIELRWDVLRKLGKSILFIVVFEVLVTFGLVFPALYWGLGVDLNISLLLAAVSSATAPAATVAVIRQYRARGPLTSTILAVVGIDDALALILYVFVQGYVSANLLGQNPQLLVTLGQAGLSVLMSLGIGTGVAILYSFILRKVKNNDWILMVLASALFLLLGLAELLGISELLAAMVFGVVVANSSPALSKKSEGLVSGFAPIFLALFFILGGAHLDVGLILAIGVTGLVYFFARSLGKIGGATLGAFLGGASKTIRTKIGLSLLPQVGVALALALSISQEFTQPRYGLGGQELAQIVINVLLLTTVATEIIGPLLTRRALHKAGETQDEG